MTPASVRQRTLADIIGPQVGPLSIGTGISAPAGGFPEAGSKSHVRLNILWALLDLIPGVAHALYVMIKPEFERRSGQIRMDGDRPEHGRGEKRILDAGAL